MMVSVSDIEILLSVLQASLTNSSIDFSSKERTLLDLSEFTLQSQYGFIHWGLKIFGRYDMNIGDVHERKQFVGAVRLFHQKLLGKCSARQRIALPGGRVEYLYIYQELRCHHNIDE
jgi:hypothetical protein